MYVCTHACTYTHTTHARASPSPRGAIVKPPSPPSLLYNLPLPVLPHGGTVMNPPLLPHCYKNKPLLPHGGIVIKPPCLPSRRQLRNTVIKPQLLSHFAVQNSVLLLCPFVIPHLSLLTLIYVVLRAPGSECLKALLLLGAVALLYIPRHLLFAHKSLRLRQIVRGILIGGKNPPPTR